MKRHKFLVAMLICTLGLSICGCSQGNVKEVQSEDIAQNTIESTAQDSTGMGNYRLESEVEVVTNDVESYTYNREKVEEEFKNAEEIFNSRFKVIDEIKKCVKTVYDVNAEKLPDGETGWWVNYDTQVIGFDAFSMSVIGRILPDFRSEDKREEFHRIQGLANDNSLVLANEFKDIYAEELKTYRSFRKNFYNGNMVTLEDIYQGESYATFGEFYDQVISGEVAAIESVQVLKEVADKEQIEFNIELTDEELNTRYNSAKAEQAKWIDFYKKTYCEIMNDYNKEMVEEFNSANAVNDKLLSIAIKAYECTDNSSLAEVKKWADTYLTNDDIDAHNKKVGDKDWKFAQNVIMNIVNLPSVKHLSQASGLINYTIDNFAPRFENLTISSNWEEQGDGGYNVIYYKYVEKMLKSFNIFKEADTTHTIEDKPLSEWMGVKLTFYDLVIENKLPDNVN